MRDETHHPQTKSQCHRHMHTAYRTVPKLLLIYIYIYYTSVVYYKHGDDFNLSDNILSIHIGFLM